MNTRPSLPTRSSLADSSHRHYLFILPATVSDLEYELVLGCARNLAVSNHVYLFIEGQTVLFDADGIYFLPLLPDQMPTSNAVMSVFVLHNAALAQVAFDHYEDADVLLLNPRQDVTPPARSPSGSYDTQAGLWAFFSAHPPAMRPAADMNFLSSCDRRSKHAVTALSAN